MFNVSKVIKTKEIQHERSVVQSPPLFPVILQLNKILSVLFNVKIMLEYFYMKKI